MKKNVLSLLLLVMSTITLAQAPNKMSFQTVVRNSQGKLVLNKSIGVRISILQSTSTGTAVYVETHTQSSNANGLLTLEVGSGSVSIGTFSTIDWTQGPYFLKTEMDVNGGTNYTISGVTEFVSVPYALNSKASDATKTLSNGANVGDMNYWNGTTWVPLNVGAEGQILTFCGGKPTWTIGGVCPGIIQNNVSDIEGNTYKIAQIGTQVWMAENLKTSKYSDGTTIPNVTDNNQWGNIATGAWCFQDNNSVNNAKYGKLYNWYAVSTITNGNKNICPTGWHVPTDAEWMVLIDYLGGETVAGGKLKEVGTTNWLSPNTGATNTSLFTGLPGGGRFNLGYYSGIGSSGYWWSSTENSTINSWCHYLESNIGVATIIVVTKEVGLSVRCLRD